MVRFCTETCEAIFTQGFPEETVFHATNYGAGRSFVLARLQPGCFAVQIYGSWQRLDSDSIREMQFPTTLVSLLSTIAIAIERFPGAERKLTDKEVSERQGAASKMRRAFDARLTPQGK